MKKPPCGKLFKTPQRVEGLRDSTDYFDIKKDLSDDKLRLYGLPDNYIENDMINASYDGKLFVPGEKKVFNPQFPRCPERVRIKFK